MNLHNSYFAIDSPLVLLDRWLNPWRHRLVGDLGDYPLLVRWTERAERALSTRARPLAIEMQIYFSCVVKKRVLFLDESGGNVFRFGSTLNLSFRPVEASSCDPVTFAAYYPERRPFTSPAARRMHPRELRLDYRKGRWHGEFDI